MTDQQLQEQLQLLFQEKTFSPKDTGLTSRQINDWSDKGLLSDFRSSTPSWHKFSLAELIEVSAYRELRACGFPIENLKKLKKYFESDAPIVIHNNKISSSDFILAIIKACFIEEMGVMTNRDADFVEFFDNTTFKLKLSCKSLITTSLKSIIRSIPLLENNEILPTIKIDNIFNQPMYPYMRLVDSDFYTFQKEITKRKLADISTNNDVEFI